MCLQERATSKQSQWLPHLDAVCHHNVLQMRGDAPRPAGHHGEIDMTGENDARALGCKRAAGSNSGDEKTDFPACEAAETDGALASFKVVWTKRIVEAEKFHRPSPLEGDLAESSRG